MRSIAQHFLCRSALLLAALLCLLPAVRAQEVPSEQSIRAAMVFNFLKFTQFPAESGAPRPLRLCVAVAETRQADALIALAGRKVGGRELSVSELTHLSEDCQVLYVDSRRRWSAAAEQRASRRALTISAYPGFVRDGGMIEIAVQNDGTRFDINLTEGRRVGFHFSPQLLRLARQVHE